jgi:DNA-nicking Smr family endonuclease
MSDSHDDELFRDAMRGVRRLKKEATAHRAPKAEPRARFRRADEQAVLRESLTIDPATVETGDELAFRRDHVTPAVLRKLRNGEYAVDAEIDLHGLNANDSARVLKSFLAEAVMARLSCVRIVHGKGRRSGPGGPVLKNVVNVTLRRLDVIVAFGSARPIDGGTGAVYALLRK